MISTTSAPRVVHAIPGRVRVHVPAWIGAPPDRVGRLRRELGRLGGVRRAAISTLTGNVLLHFDPGITDPARLAGAIALLSTGATAPDLAPLGRGLLAVATVVPRVRRGLHALFGRRVGTLIAFLPGILGVIRALAASSGPVGLAVAGFEAAQLFGEIGGALRAA